MDKISFFPDLVLIYKKKLDQTPRQREVDGWSIIELVYPPKNFDARFRKQILKILIRSHVIMLADGRTKYWH